MILIFYSFCLHHFRFKSSGGYSDNKDATTPAHKTAPLSPLSPPIPSAPSGQWWVFNDELVSQVQYLLMEYYTVPSIYCNTIPNISRYNIHSISYIIHIILFYRVQNINMYIPNIPFFSIQRTYCQQQQQQRC